MLKKNSKSFTLMNLKEFPGSTQEMYQQINIIWMLEIQGRNINMMSIFNQKIMMKK